VGNSRIHALIGGLHLFDASKERLQNTVTGLEVFGVQVLAACHCTGFSAIAALQRHFGNKVAALYAGHSITL
jgi:7,8-dihydropterin-6-yl-methyl-4-(beta-D-ribofuranosyl)aminobenzene 5'-phosphate synthase